MFSPTSQLQQVWPPLGLATCGRQPWAVRVCQRAGGRVGYDPWQSIMSGAHGWVANPDPASSSASLSICHTVQTWPLIAQTQLCSSCGGLTQGTNLLLTLHDQDLGVPLGHTQETPFLAEVAAWLFPLSAYISHTDSHLAETDAPSILLTPVGFSSSCMLTPQFAAWTGPLLYSKGKQLVLIRFSF